MNNLTASIVVYKNDLRVLKKTIQSCLSSYPEITIYVIDNSPTDAARDICCDPRIEYIFNDQNFGFGRAHNIALKKVMSQSKYHLVINPDVYFQKSVIPDLLNYMEANDNVGIVMPKVLYPDGSLQYLCRLLPTPYHLISRRFIAKFKNIESSNQKYEMHFTGYNHIMDVPFISGCFMFIRTEALTKAGLFDERIFMYTEDIDLSRRIRKYYRTVFFPKAIIFHEHFRESYKPSLCLLYHINSAIKYFNKWGWFKDEERDKINEMILLNYNSNDSI